MANPVLAAAGALFLAAPLVLAWRIDRQVASFQREAFGHLRKAARNLRLMGWAMFAYYAGVLGGSLYVGDLPQAFEWPLTKEGLVIYLRIGAAILGYLLASFVARELYLVTRPGPATRQRPPPAAEP